MTPGAARARRTRMRRRNGLASYRLNLVEIEVAEGMILSGRMGDDATARRDLVERELERLIGEWCERWRRNA